MAWFPLESIQMIAAIGGEPSDPTATVPDHWAVHPTPIISSGATPGPSSARREAVTDGRPPVVGVLLGAAPVEQVQVHRLGGVGHDPPGGRHHRHLGPAGAEVDGEDEGSPSPVGLTP